MLLRQEPKRFTVRWLDCGEVAAVEGGELRLVEHLSGCEHGGIDQAERQIAVAFEQLAGAP